MDIPTDFVPKYDKLVHWFACKYVRPGSQHYGDCVQQIWLLLLEALETHDPAKGELTTHACFRVRARMRTEVRKLLSTIHRPYWAREEVPRLHRAGLFEHHTKDDTAQDRIIDRISLAGVESLRYSDLLNWVVEGKRISDWAAARGVSRQRGHQIWRRLQQDARRIVNGLSSDK